MAILSNLILKEMESNFAMIRTAIVRMDGNFWKKDQKDWVYGYIIFHVMEAIEFYLSESADQWNPMTEISSNSRKIETEKINAKDKSFFIDYQSQLETKTFEVLKSWTEKQLLDNDGFSPRGFISRLHKYSYVIRHSMFHLGELTQSLRQQDLNRIDWA